MSAGHTLGRLILRGGWSLYAEDGGAPVADACIASSAPDGRDEANARRLAACWNAFDGIETDRVDLIVANGSLGLGSAFAQLGDQRDDLLAALQSIIENSDDDGAIECARAAVAKATDGAA